MPIEQLTAQSVPKAWGHEEVVVNIPDAYSPRASDTICGSPGYCGKILHLRAGWQCSLHRHKTKDETFFCVTGQVLLEYGDSPDALQSLVLDGDFRPVVRILPGTWHRFSAITSNPTEVGRVAALVEFSTPHSDDDVERFEASRPVKLKVGFDNA